MREFKYGVGVIATIFLLNLLLVKLSEKSSTTTDFRGKNQKDMSHDGSSQIYFKLCRNTDHFKLVLKRYKSQRRRAYLQSLSVTTSSLIEVV